MIVGGRPYEAKLDRDQGWMRSRWGLHRLEIQDLEIAAPRPVTGDGRVKAPIPGQVIDLLVAIGDEVQLGQPLLILGAMKMENEIRAPRSGVIERLNVRAGQSVDLHQVLVEIV
jgi:biotin carboxyl carrier protein